MEENTVTKSAEEINAEMGLVNRPDINEDIKALNLPEGTVAFELALFFNDGSVRYIWNGMDGAKAQYLFNGKIESYIRADLNNAKLIKKNLSSCYKFVKDEQERNTEVSGQSVALTPTLVDTLVEAMKQEVIESKQELDELRSKQTEALKQESPFEVSPNE